MPPGLALCLQQFQSINLSDKDWIKTACSTMLEKLNFSFTELKEDVEEEKGNGETPIESREDKGGEEDTGDADPQEDGVAEEQVHLLIGRVLLGLQLQLPQPRELDRQAAAEEVKMKMD